jgi:acetyltransferase
MSLLSPSSIAVIGASATPGKVGHDVLKNLLEQGYEGTVYPVNPKGGIILGHAVHASIGEIRSTPEMAVVITPAPTVPGVLEECAAAGTLQVIIISAGFKETNTDEGKRLEAEVARIAREKKMTVIGPNCLGLLRPSVGMNASFAKDVPPAGGIALVSQSGAFAVAILDAAPALRMGFSSVVSIGNKAVTDECDLLELLADDAETTVIGLYLESIVDGRRFRDVAARVSRKKPVVLLKAGVSSFGRRAAASHTGALAGSDGAVDAVCRQAGIRRAHDLEEFTDLLRALSVQPALQEPRIAVVTNAGGPGILAADAAERCGLTLPPLADVTIAALKESLPPAAGLNNPVDVVGDAGADRYAAAIQACMRDPNVDGLIVLLTPQVMTPCAEVARLLVGASRKSKMLPIATSFMGGGSVVEAIGILGEAGIPNFATPERAVRAMAGLRMAVSTPRTPGTTQVNAQRQQQAAAILGKNEGLLPEDATHALFALYGIPAPLQRLARSAEDAAAMAQEIGYPVVAKVSSPDIIHKTDVGGIRIGLQDAAAIRDAYTEIEANVRRAMPNARWNGVLVQQQLPPGDECIVGGVRDPSFGPLVMAGLGGIFTELFRDTGLRLAPIKEEDAYALLSELKSWAMLLGMRGRSPRDIPALARILVAIGDLLVECPRITELDCNPVILGEDGVMVADGKVIVGE